MGVYMCHGTAIQLTMDLVIDPHGVSRFAKSLANTLNVLGSEPAFAHLRVNANFKYRVQRKFRRKSKSLSFLPFGRQSGAKTLHIKVWGLRVDIRDSTKPVAADPRDVVSVATVSLMQSASREMPMFDVMLNFMSNRTILGEAFAIPPTDADPGRKCARFALTCSQGSDLQTALMSFQNAVCDGNVECKVVETETGEAQIKSFILVMRWIVLRPGIELAGDGSVVWQREPQGDGVSSQPLLYPSELLSRQFSKASFMADLEIHET